MALPKALPPVPDDGSEEGSLNLDIRELKYFTQIVNSANYSHAAERLYISQPALSKVIQKLEKELGYKLFQTVQRQQRLTEDGEQFYQQAMRVIRAYDDIEPSVRMAESSCRGKVFLGFPNVAGTSFFCELISEFSRLYPNIDLHIREEGAHRVMSEVESGDLDVGCAILPVPQERFEVYPFVRDISALIVSTQHPLAKRTQITLPELKGENFVLLGTEFSTHHDICTALREAGVEPKIALLSSQWDFIIQMVRLNYGISFLPQSLFRRFSYPDIRLLEIDHLMRYEDLALITKKGRYLSRNARQLIRFLTDKMAAQTQNPANPENLFSPPGS